MIKKLHQTILDKRWLIISALAAYIAATGLVYYQTQQQNQSLLELHQTAERIKFKLKAIGNFL